MSVPPEMMGAGPMLPPGMAPPMMPPMPGAATPPAVAALPGLAQLAQEQTMRVLEEERRMMEMQEKMQREMMLLIAALPTPNPAGEAAVSTPMTPMMGGAGMGAAETAAPMPMSDDGMSGMTGAY